MAIREYVGARYVPKFMGYWSATTEYEPLCIVDDGLGTSYTSKKVVPAGTPLTDPEYWAVTGSTSGAIVALQNRVTALENIFATPEFFGAEGDGVTDDTAAFKAAMTSGMSLYVPNKEYLITDHIDIPDNTVIMGEGLIIDRYDADADGHTNDNHVGCFNINSADNVRIEGLRFEGRGASSGQWNHGCHIYVGQSTNVNIRDCEFYNTDKAYAIAYDGSDTGTVDSCYIHQYTYSGIMCLNSCKNIAVINNKVLDCKGKTANHCYPISLAGYDYPITSIVPEAENNSAINNIIENDFPWWEGIDAHGGINLRIIGNTIKNCYCGIAVVGETNGYYLPDEVVITDNIVIGPKSSGSAETFTNAGLNLTRAKNVIVANNEFSGWGQISSNSNMAIRIANSENVNFVNNNIHDSGIATGSLIEVRGEHINIASNNIKNNPVLYTFELIGSVKDVSITDNFIKGSGSNGMVYAANAIAPSGSSLNNKVSRNFSDNPTCRQFGDIYKPQTCSMASGGGPVTTLHCGDVGDIVYNVAPAAGNPPGWICTTAQVDENTPAVYAKMAALS